MLNFREIKTKKQFIIPSEIEGPAIPAGAYRIKQRYFGSAHPPTAATILSASAGPQQPRP